MTLKAFLAGVGSATPLWVALTLKTCLPRSEMRTLAARSTRKSPTVEDLLDELLPLASAEQVECHHNATLLTDGTVLVSGGDVGGFPTATAQLFTEPPTVVLDPPGGLLASDAANLVVSEETVGPVDDEADD